MKSYRFIISHFTAGSADIESRYQVAANRSEGGSYVTTNDKKSN